MTPQQTIWRTPAMSYAEAHRILNERRKGADMDEQQVLKALELTGDYDPDADFQRLYEVEA